MPPILFWPLVVILTALFILWALSWREENGGPDGTDWIHAVGLIASVVFSLACLAMAAYICFLIAEAIT